MCKSEREEQLRTGRCRGQNEKRERRGWKQKEGKKWWVQENKVMMKEFREQN